MQYFSALIKPASSLCNMRCTYCFYHDVAQNRATPSFGVMTEETAGCLVERIAAYVSPPAAVTFLFQGGEPTLAGLPFYEMFVKLCRERFDPRVKLQFSIQTNGLLLDADWCAFLKRHGFLVGLSWDGPGEIHDLSRLDARGRGTCTAVRRTAQLLRAHGVEFNVLCVVTKAAARHPEQLLRFFLRQGIRQIQFIPCLEPLEGQGRHPYSLTPEAYGNFLIRTFDVWLQEQKEGRALHIRTFDNLLLLLQGRPAEQCGAMGFCTAQFVVEADGSVYPCDFYVVDAYRCGSIQRDTIPEIQRNQNLRAFLAHKEPKPSQCANCPVIRFCGGGCRRYRGFYGEQEGYCPMQAYLMHAMGALREGNVDL